MSFTQWKTDSLRFWNKLRQDAAPPKEAGLWYSISKSWSREIPVGGGDDHSSALTVLTRKKVQVYLLRLLDRAWDYSHRNPDVVLFLFTFLVVRWDLRPYYLQEDEATTPTTHVEGKPKRGATGRHDDRTSSAKGGGSNNHDGQNKNKKEYKDKGLYNFMAQCQAKKHKLRPVVREKKVYKSDSSSAFLELSPEKLRNLRGNLKSSPGNLV
jgi:hypothetical protein